MARRVRGVFAAGAGALLLLAPTGCSSGGDDTAAPPSEVSSAAPVEESADARNPPLSVPIPDGRYSAVITRVDPAKRTVVFNPFAWMTGKAARRIHSAEYLDDQGGPPNDYVIVNQTDTLWRAPVAKRVTVRLVRLDEDGDADLDKGTLKELPEYLRGGSGRKVPFWLVVRDEKVVAIEEQYVP